MPIFLLGEEPVFPPAQLASQEGIVATGGDLSPLRLLNAYASGIFPWFTEDEPILWWSPDPRAVLLPGGLHISGSMKKLLKKRSFQVTLDQCFADVLRHCASPRKGQAGTWLTDEMQAAYIQLHEMGYAHSVEVWQSDQLAGGLYGVSLGKCFFGESMFTKKSNASKFAFIALARLLFQKEFLMIDCQVPNEHLDRLGVNAVPRTDFLDLLKKGLKHESITGKWEI
ncbi:MAG: leucyl/phenylalanyl-tRNA--protein transferase [bacterium]|nr:leucyl/phenylalanyl-tRNA--protein transferase [bacterium]